MEIKDIVELIKAVSNSELTSFTYEGEEGKITMEASRRKEEILVQAAGEAISAPVAKKAAEKGGECITSPMVGTFYAAPAEDAAPYISVGDTIHKGQVIGIVEAMKLMNEVESPYDGTVEEILVENKEMVGFGQELVRIHVKQA